MNAFHDQYNVACLASWKTLLYDGVAKTSAGPYRTVGKQLCKYGSHIKHSRFHGRGMNRAHWEARAWKLQFFPSCHLSSCGGDGVRHRKAQSASASFVLRLYCDAIIPLYLHPQACGEFIRLREKQQQLVPACSG